MKTDSEATMAVAEHSTAAPTVQVRAETAPFSLLKSKNLS